MTRTEPVVVIACDAPGCDEELWGVTSSLITARRAARRYSGWVRRDGHDYCFDHAELPARAAPEESHATVR